MDDSSMLKVDESCSKLPSSSVNGGTKVGPGTNLKPIMDAKCLNGRQKVYQHHSTENNCLMRFSIYIPETEDANQKFHVVIFLSGIMCNEQNFLLKTGFQQYASEQNLIVVGADTSPRKPNILDG